MDSDRFPYPDDDDDTIAPDVAPRDQEPISPAEAVKLEREKYADSSFDENRDDQADVHHGDIDDIV